MKAFKFARMMSGYAYRQRTYDTGSIVMPVATALLMSYAAIKYHNENLPAMALT